jgi:signal transduction histidine kinase/CheY-like chemotaxis protein
MVSVLTTGGSAADEPLCRATFTDVSALKRAQAARTLLADASAALASSLAYSETVAAVGNLLVPTFADLCLVDLIRPGGEHERIAAFAGTIPFEVCDAMRAAAFHSTPPSAQERVLLTGQTVELFGETCVEAVPAEVADGVQPTGVLAVPLAVRGRCLGVLSLFFLDSTRSYASSDLALAEDLGRRIAVALDNAYLYGEAQEAVRARDNVLSLVSHDLRNQLSAVLLGIESVVAMAPSTDRRKDRRRLDIVRRNAELMHKMTDDLLDVSSIEAGTLAMSCAPSSLRALLMDAHESAAPIARDAGIELAVAVPPGDATVLCDRERTLQVLANLIGNAAKFVPRGGKVGLRAERDEAAWSLIVEDNGPGIARDAQRHIFERHWQARATARKGHGLGLYISKKIVEGMGGKISVESDLGRGATFAIRLPSAPATELRPIEGEVLVIDDNSDLRGSVAEVLSRRGYQVLEAADGQEAFEILESRVSTKIVLLDLHMPRMDGRAFLGSLRADPRVASLPVVLMSSERDFERNTGDLVVDGYLPKPFAEERLLEIVRRLGGFPSRDAWSS